MLRLQSGFEHFMTLSSRGFRWRLGVQRSTAIAVEQTRLRFPDVAFFDLSTAKRAICVRARDAVVDENEPSPAQKSTRACVRLVGTHAELVWSAPAAAEARSQ